MLSALVGSGYGWGGWFVGLLGGEFSLGFWVGGCGLCVFVCGVRGGRVDCRVGGAGALGVWGVLGKKTLLPRGSFQKCGFQGGVNFVSKFMLKRETCVKEGVRVGLEG